MAWNTPDWMKSDWAKKATNLALGTQVGGTMDALDTSPQDIAEGDYGIAGDILGGPGRAAEYGIEGAQNAMDYVEGGYGQAITNMQPYADYGAADVNTYRNNVNQGIYSTDPGKFQTDQYNPQQWGGDAPGFNQFDPGGGPQYQQYGMGQDPGFNAFQQQQGPQFQGGPQDDFSFDYESSPGFQAQMDKTLGAIAGKHSAQGSRFGAGRDKESMDYAAGAVARDYGNQYGRARQAYESERGYGAGQANLANQWGQRQHEFGTGIDVGQSNMGNQYGQNAFQFEQGMGFAGNQAMNQQDMGNYWNAAGMNNQNNMWANNMNNQNYWTGQGMNMQDQQFGAEFNMGANQQNYDQQNQQQMQQAGMMGGLANQGTQDMNSLNNMLINEGGAMGSASLGLSNAQAYGEMLPWNMSIQGINAVAGGAGAIMGGGNIGYTPPLDPYGKQSQGEGGIYDKNKM